MRLCLVLLSLCTGRGLTNPPLPSFLVFFFRPQFLASGLDVYQNNKQWVAAGRNVSSSMYFYFVIENLVDLFEGYKVSVGVCGISCAHVCMYVCMYVCMCVCGVHVYACMRFCVCRQACMCVHMCVCVYAYVYAHICKGY